MKDTTTWISILIISLLAGISFSIMEYQTGYTNGYLDSYHLCRISSLQHSLITMRITDRFENYSNGFEWINLSQKCYCDGIVVNPTRKQCFGCT